MAPLSVSIVDKRNQIFCCKQVVASKVKLENLDILKDRKVIEKLVSSVFGEGCSTSDVKLTVKIKKKCAVIRLSRKAYFVYKTCIQNVEPPVNSNPRTFVRMIFPALFEDPLLNFSLVKLHHDKVLYATRETLISIPSHLHPSVEHVTLSIKKYIREHKFHSKTGIKLYNYVVNMFSLASVEHPRFFSELQHYSSSAIQEAVESDNLSKLAYIELLKSIAYLLRNKIAEKVKVNELELFEQEFVPNLLGYLLDSPHFNKVKIGAKKTLIIKDFVTLLLFDHVKIGLFLNYKTRTINYIAKILNRLVEKGRIRCSEDDIQWSILLRTAVQLKLHTLVNHICRSSFDYSSEAFFYGLKFDQQDVINRFSAFYNPNKRIYHIKFDRTDFSINVGLQKYLPVTIALLDDNEELAWKLLLEDCGLQFNPSENCNIYIKEYILKKQNELIKKREDHIKALKVYIKEVLDVLQMIKELIELTFSYLYFDVQKSLTTAKTEDGDVD